MMKIIFALHIFATFFMTGVIWFVQIVHYPLFSKVGQPEFFSYHAQHIRRVSYIVLPAMIVELMTGIYLMWIAKTVDWYVSIGLLGLIWISTFFIQVPCHQKLEKGFEKSVWQRLVYSNLIRTILWTIRAAVFILIL